MGSVLSKSVGLGALAPLLRLDPRQGITHRGSRGEEGKVIVREPQVGLSGIGVGEDAVGGGHAVSRPTSRRKAATSNISGASSMTKARFVGASMPSTSP